MPGTPPPRATSRNGVWVFEDGALRSGEVVVHPDTLDFFSRWTFARFLPGGQLALGFETSQPWSEWGSYGDRCGGVQVLAEVAPGDWQLVAIQYDVRGHDESFEPDDVCWHPRGVLAWLREGMLDGLVRAEPRGPIAWDLVPERDGDRMAFAFDAYGSWRSLALDDEGRVLTAIDDDGVDAFDLVALRRRRDDGPWEPLEVWRPEVMR